MNSVALRDPRWHINDPVSSSGEGRPRCWVTGVVGGWLGGGGWGCRSAGISHISKGFHTVTAMLINYCGSLIWSLFICVQILIIGAERQSVLVWFTIIYPTCFVINQMGCYIVLHKHFQTFWPSKWSEEFCEYKWVVSGPVHTRVEIFKYYNYIIFKCTPLFLELELHVKKKNIEKATFCFLNTHRCADTASETWTAASPLEWISLTY